MTPSTPSVREIWLVVAQGGWWTSEEIKRHIDPHLNDAGVRNRLWIMTYRQGVLKTRGEGKERQYAVTPECFTPYGITVRKLTEALVGQ